MHGGGFRSGNKRNGTIANLAKNLTMRGYALFSINYRLTGGHSKKPVLDA